MNVREWALPVYTILMQMSVGALLVLWVIRFLTSSKFTPGDIDRIVQIPIFVVAITSAVAMVAAHFHLSQPFQSYRAVLNFKSSWLSREIVFSFLFFLMLIGLLYLTSFETKRRSLITALGCLTILTGIIMVYCMAMIYLLPTQVAWNSTSVIVSFYTTTLLIGTAALACLLTLDLKFAEIQKIDDVDLRVEITQYFLGGLTVLIMVLVFMSIAIIYFQMYSLGQGGLIARTSLTLLMDLYFPLLVIRQVLLVGAALFLGYAVMKMYRLKLKPQSILVPVYLSCLLILVGEIFGRFLFYATHIRVGL